MIKEEAIKVLQEIVDGNWDNQSVEAIQYAIDALSQPSLPSNLDEAAEKYLELPENPSSNQLEDLLMYRAFKDGAEWMAGQGYIRECTVDRTPLNGPAGICMNLHEYTGFKIGDKVIVQIRKKE